MEYFRSTEAATARIARFRRAAHDDRTVREARRIEREARRTTPRPRR